jgi:hypothetical protein
MVQYSQYTDDRNCMYLIYVVGVAATFRRDEYKLQGVRKNIFLAVGD